MIFFNSYPYGHTMPVVITEFIIEKIVRRIKGFFIKNRFFGKNPKKCAFHV